MASAELTKLYQLHLVDVGILEIKKKAAGLNAAKQQFETQLASLKEAADLADKEFHRLHAEQKDLELSNKQLDDKIKAIDKRMFDGSVGNQKEVDAMAHQQASFKAMIEANEENLLALFDSINPAEKAKFAALNALTDKQKEANAWKEKAVTFKKQLEEKYADLTMRRPKIAEKLPAALLARYEGLRQMHHGIGMSVITRESTCQECGNHVAEKAIESINDDRIATCEDCHRILYWTGGVV
ncbi:MAG TPA: hypothetical protein VK171_10205 [Fimbriimonas sp.]|nr:hypothetical protein [Fimbriimonas sp.]